MQKTNGTESWEDDDIDVGKIIHLILEHWLLLAFSVVIGLAVARAYIWYTHPIYQMTTTVLVEDKDRDISQSILDEVGMVSKSRNIENEIAILNSRSMMETAVSKLNLNVNYAIELGLRSRDFYKKSPILLDYTLNSDAPETFEVHVALSIDSSNAHLLFSWDSGPLGEGQSEHTATLGESFENPLGSFNLSATDWFSKLKENGDIRNQSFVLNYRSTDKLTSLYLDELKVEPEREKSSILRLKLRDRVAQRGIDVLNALLDVYVQNNIEKKNQLASNSLKFIDAQLDVITEDLSSLEEKIKGFKTTNGITDVSAEATFFLEQVGTLDRTVSEIDVKLSIINYLEDYIASDKNLKNASPSSLGIEDPLLNQLITRLSELTAERETMLKSTREANPVINSTDTKIQETKNALRKNLESIRNSLLASKGEVVKQLAVIEKKVEFLPKAEYELLALQRQYSIKESLYLLLLGKKSENSILLASTVSDNVVIDIARSTDSPVAPKRNFTYLLGLLGGLIAPSLYLLILLFVDNRVKDVNDLKRATNIPVLSLIPHMNEDKYLVISESANSAISEAFRSVRTNLSFLVRKDDLKTGVSEKVIQFTSAMGSEGKSFCSINLAASIALGGSKTIVVGLDLRKPKLAEYFDLPNKVGASSVLAGIESLEEAIVKTNVQNLDVLVGGPIPPNPSELLMSAGLTNMLDDLTSKYDQIILDTPPIGLVADSLIISEHAAATIYVVRQNTTNASSLSYITELYQAQKIKNVAILFNDVKASRFGYGYGYGYGHGYYAESVNSNDLKSKILRLFKRG